MENLLRIRIKTNELLFYLVYTLFYISLFVTDIEQTTYDFASVGKIIRYCSLVLMALSIFIIHNYRKNLLLFLVFFAFGILMFISTHATFFLAVAMLWMMSCRIDNKRILRYTLKLLCILTLIVIIAQETEILSNIVTSRWLNDTANRRLSMGFYHSNVIPLIYAYIIIYYLALKGNNIKGVNLYCILAISLIVYYICGSRNALFSVFLIAMLIWIFDIRKNKPKKQKILNYIARYIVGFYSIVSIMVSLFFYNNPIVKRVDYLISYRIRYGHIAFKNCGVQLLNCINAEEYSTIVPHVVDNGYILLSVRYGILIIVIISIVSYFAVKHFNDPVISIVVIGVASMNLIDNDFLDYLCLPLLLIGIKQCILCKRQSYRQRVMINGKIDICNHEYVQ